MNEIVRNASFDDDTARYLMRQILELQYVVAALATRVPTLSHKEQSIVEMINERLRKAARETPTA